MKYSGKKLQNENIEVGFANKANWSFLNSLHIYVEVVK
jgi:hypothetical protein